MALISACSSSTGTTTPSVTPTPSPTASGATPAPATDGVAYIPDGGLTGAAGIYMVHFEDVYGHLLPSGTAVSAPTIVSFQHSVGPIAFASDGTLAIAAMGPAGTYDLVQDVLGLSTASIVPVGVPYAASIPPSPPASPFPTPTPNADAVSNMISGAAIVGGSSLAVGIVVSPTSKGILGIGSLNAAPPVFGGYVPFDNGVVNLPAGNAFYNVESGPAAGQVIVRGPSAFEVFTITQPGGTFQFQTPVVNSTLGYQAGPLFGRGGMAINGTYPASAILLRTPTANGVQFISGLPGVITVGNHLTLASQPNSVYIVPNTSGNLAVVGTNAGFYIISGVNTGTLVVEKPYLLVGSDGAANSPKYVGCDGNQHQLQNVSSIGVSFDQRYIAALGHPTGSTCGSLVVVPLVDTTNGTPSPSPTPSPGTTNPPTMFVQNNLPAPNPNTDYMRVR